VEILDKQHDGLVTGAEVWFVRPDHIDDVLRVCIASNGTPRDGARTPLVLATDAELTAGPLTGLLRSAVVGLDLPLLHGVSVGYPLDADPPFVVRRTRDLTPTAWEEIKGFAPTENGGAARYLAFLVDELLPALAAELPVDPAEATLAGASFGGLFTLFALLERPGAFRRYLAESPSVWWHDGVLLERLRAAAAGPAPAARVYLCTGELENKARFHTQFARVLDRLPASMAGADMVGDMFVVEQLLREWGVPVEAHVYPQESHESLIGAALSRGLRRLHGTL
jgi:uncharacterized protein